MLTYLIAYLNTSVITRSIHYLIPYISSNSMYYWSIIWWIIWDKKIELQDILFQSFDHQSTIIYISFQFIWMFLWSLLWILFDCFSSSQLCSGILTQIWTYPNKLNCWKYRRSKIPWPYLLCQLYSTGAKKCHQPKNNFLIWKEMFFLLLWVSSNSVNLYGNVQDQRQLKSTCQISQSKMLS